MVAGGCAVLRRAAPAHLGLMAARLAYHTSPHPTERVPAPSGQARAIKLRANGRCYLERRRPNTQRGSGRQEVAALAGHGVIGKQHDNGRDEYRYENDCTPE